MKSKCFYIDYFKFLEYMRVRGSNGEMGGFRKEGCEFKGDLGRLVP